MLKFYFLTITVLLKHIKNLEIIIYIIFSFILVFSYVIREKRNNIIYCNANYIIRNKIRKFIFDFLYNFFNIQI